MKREYFYIFLAFASTFPALFLRLSGFEVFPPVGIIVFGVAVVGAAFVLSWAAEVAQKDVSQNLALVFFALVAILPEYVVDLYFAWTSAQDPTYAHYALANMTGANRLLIGFGWATVVVLHFMLNKKRGIELEDRRSIDIFWLTIFVVYGFVIVIKGTLSLLDGVVLVALFGAYVLQAARAGVIEPELLGPPAELAKFPTWTRRLITILLFAYSSAAILAVAEPFAESLVRSGVILGISEFFLVQWLAPLASEAPEFVVVCVLVAKKFPSMALGALISSKVNQWSLLVGAVPIVYVLGQAFVNRSFVWGLDLDHRQVGEILLTGAQGFYAVSLIVNYQFRVREGIALGGLFLIDITTTILLEETGHTGLIQPFHYALSFLYISLGLIFFAVSWNFLPRIVKLAWYGGKPNPMTPRG